ncbi:hypothetical protein C8J57DRAFT_1629244, partial [Mycena rebaudengoi]
RGSRNLIPSWCWHASYNVWRGNYRDRRKQGGRRENGTRRRISGGLSCGNVGLHRHLMHLPLSRHRSQLDPSGGKVRFRNRCSEYLNLNARFGSAFGGDQARSNAERKIEPEVKISVTSTANEVQHSTEKPTHRPNSHQLRHIAKKIYPPAPFKPSVAVLFLVLVAEVPNLHPVASSLMYKEKFSITVQWEILLRKSSKEFKRRVNLAIRVPDAPWIRLALRTIWSTHAVSENICAFLVLNFAVNDCGTSACIEWKVRDVPHHKTAPEPCWGGTSKALRAIQLRDDAAARIWEERKVLDTGSIVTPSNAKPR